ncbi:Gfo/Idh/MocA family protein [Bdellovibrio bacteriovorus]|uniref:Gfo/Idh/MocA family protein n=1 Tax=Bdellovibrio bacteriovorus TaxID=959 RepID=UPI0035A5A751
MASTSAEKVLIVGYGSIGKRHLGAFEAAGAEVAVVTQQDVTHQKIYRDVSSAVVEYNPGIVVVANSTDKHLAALENLKLAGFKGIVLVEKPLADKVISFKHSFAGLYVAYNLRRSPLLTRLKEELKNREVVTAHVYCGQYLPGWRPQRDYREVYSAKKDQGGGVLRDLSHELDYTQWLFGNFEYLAAQGGHFSNLEIDSDDVFTLLGKTQKSPHVVVSINYLDRVARRTILVHCQDATLFVDMVAGRLMINSEVVLDNLKVADTYLEQARSLIEGRTQSLSSFDDGMSVLKLIEAAEHSAQERKFINL